MNVLGKIFVIANLVFSVVTAALIMVVYSTRTNWHNSYNLMKAQRDTAQANSLSYGELVDKAKKEAKTQHDALESNLTSVRAELQKTVDQHAVLVEQLTKEKAAYEKIIQENKGIAEVNNRLQKESDLLKKNLGDSNMRIVNLEKEKATFRNRAVEAEIASAQQNERNGLLLEDNERLTKDLQKEKARSIVSKPGTGGANPPLEDIEGVVEASDPQSGFVTITVGANHGIKKDHTLDVFRLAPEGRFLATIRIMDVRADKAVGKPVARPSAPIQAGDRVVSSLQRVNR